MVVYSRTWMVLWDFNSARSTFCFFVSIPLTKEETDSKEQIICLGPWQFEALSHTWHQTGRTWEGGPLPITKGRAGQNNQRYGNNQQDLNPFELFPKGKMRESNLPII